MPQRLRSETLPVEPDVLVIGDAEHAEFHAPLAAMAHLARVHVAADCVVAARLIRDGLRPMVIVIAQRRPGEVPREAVEHLQRLAPLAPFVAIQSSWCDGEGRSGQPLPGVLRVPWRRFESDVLPGLGRLRNGELPDWAGPATLTAEERLLRQSVELPPAGRGMVGILSQSREARSLVGDACRSGGWSTVIPCGTHGDPCPQGQDGHATACACDVAIWDANELPDDLLPAMRLLREHFGDPQIIVLLGFPRAHDIERAIAAGAADVVGKPFAPGELLRRIGDVASRRSTATRQE
jgi:CheY-like chemotaxis protein